MLTVTQAELVELAQRWEPAASASPPGRRLSRCAGCGRRTVRPWHIWLRDGGFRKELHVCNGCVRRRGWTS